MFFGERLAAGQATKALQAIAVLAEPFSCVAAASGSAQKYVVFFRFHTLIIQQAAVVCQASSALFSAYVYEVS
jgi:hypothetical protein